MTSVSFFEPQLFSSYLLPNSPCAVAVASLLPHAKLPAWAAPATDLK